MTLHQSLCIETEAKQDFTLRLLVVANEIKKLIVIHNPELIALEELYFTNNAKTAIHVAEIRGMLIYLAVSEHISIQEFNPLSIKIALTGFGRATKEQVIKMVEKLVIMKVKPKHDDEYDAIALGITAIAGIRHTQIRKI